MKKLIPILIVFLLTSCSNVEKGYLDSVKEAYADFIETQLEWRVYYLEWNNNPSVIQDKEWLKKALPVMDANWSAAKILIGIEAPSKYEEAQKCVDEGMTEWCLGREGERDFLVNYNHDSLRDAGLHFQKANLLFDEAARKFESILGDKAGGLPGVNVKDSQTKQTFR